MGPQHAYRAAPGAADFLNLFSGGVWGRSGGVLGGVWGCVGGIFEVFWEVFRG